ncbi:MAG: prepilin peptidase [Thermoguttaceae bacterium]|jgi:prepilin peptidase CpaA
MSLAPTLPDALIDHWQVWLLSAVLVLAAMIDGWKLRVPNWLTFPLVIGGWTLSAIGYGWEGLAWSLTGTAVGLALLLPAYAIGGMGAGDVKLLAGVGAWVWGTTTCYAFCVSAVVGGVLAVGMVLVRRQWHRHWVQFRGILYEILLIRDPAKLSAIAAERKSSMMLLPYGIPIALGTIAYFVWSGMLI